MTPSPQPKQINHWLYRFLRFIVFQLVHLFYPRIEVRGCEHLPAGGPVIFIANHPNGLLDPIIITLGAQRPIAFLAKSTLFGNSIGRTFMQAFGALPIYRRRDEGLRGGPRGNAKERNEATFARCRGLLGQGQAMALFPEGISHSETQLLPLRTGAARIALSAEQEADWSMGLQIVPVGLWYQSKIHFRTSVLLVVGESFTLADEVEAYQTNEQQTVKQVTQRLKASLDKVVLQAENVELLAAMPILAAWTVPADRPAALPQQHEWTTNLLTAYEHLHQTDPTRLAEIAQQARRYANTLQTLGINDPWTLEMPRVQLGRVGRLVLLLIAGLLPALAGFILSYLPYRLAGPLAVLLMGKYPSQISTFKLIGGAILVLLGWIIEAILCGLWLGAVWGALLLVMSPPLAYAALRWGEQWRELRDLLTSRWLRWQRGELARSLVRQRRILAKQVLEAVQAAS